MEGTITIPKNRLRCNASAMDSAAQSRCDLPRHTVTAYDVPVDNRVAADARSNGFDLGEPTKLGPEVTVLCRGGRRRFDRARGWGDRASVCKFALVRMRTSERPVRPQQPGSGPVSWLGGFLRVYPVSMGLYQGGLGRSAVGWETSRNPVTTTFPPCGAVLPGCPSSIRFAWCP